MGTIIIINTPHNNALQSVLTTPQDQPQNHVTELITDVNTRQTPRRVQSGLFEIYPDGRVYRFDADGDKVPCPLVINKEYYAVSTDIRGLQVHFYLHRLLAEAFLANPDGLPLVRFLNGDKHDLRIDNLVWASYSDVKLDMYDQTVSMYECERCGEATLSKIYTWCKPCRDYDTKRRRQTQKLDRIRNQLEPIDVDLLSPRVREYANRRWDGATYQEIADEFNVTRQAVNAAITNALKQQEADHYRLFDH